MSDSQTQTESTSADSQSQPPSSEHQPGSLENTGFKWGDELPPHLKPVLHGKTAAETLDFINNLVSEAQQLLDSKSATYTAPTPTQQSRMPDNALNPELMLTDPAAWQSQFAAGMQQSTMQTIAAAAQPLLAAQAETARYMSQTDNKQVYDKWGTEVDTLVGQALRAGAVPSKALYDNAARIVKSNHIDDIVAERAAALAAANPDIARGGNTGGSAYEDQGSPDVWAKFDKSDFGKSLLSHLGKAKILRMCEDSGTSLERYADMVAGSKARINPLKPTEWSTEVARG